VNISRTWTNIGKEDLERIRHFIVDVGGNQQEVKNQYELWRIRIEKCTITAYISGKIYSTPNKDNNKLVSECWNYIDQLTGPRFVEPSKEFLIGLDETGKGELFGHLILTGVILPSKFYNKFDQLIGSADTKKRHAFSYWQKLQSNIDQYKRHGLLYLYDKIPPWYIDLYNMNKIMDVTYNRILNRLSRNVEFSNCRVVLDDYNYGEKLGMHFKLIEKQGAEIITEHKADDRYLEVKLASVISKWQREAIMYAINNNSVYQIDGNKPGSGNPNDEKTKKWLESWKQSGNSWPWFVKKTFKTIRNLNGFEESYEKIEPPIEDNILSKEFHKNFSEGKLDITSLSVVCPYCGSILKELKHILIDNDGQIFNHLICVNQGCGKVIEKANSTLRYYNGYLIPDSSAIQRRILSKDLTNNKLFEGFTILCSSIVRKECDGTPRGKKEFEILSKLHSKGIINFESIGNVIDLHDDLSNTERDECIIKDCFENNSILISADKSMVGFAIGKGVFTISL